MIKAPKIAFYKVYCGASKKLNMGGVMRKVESLIP
tara:strand:- start:643 stop:747 length:105 start_codon:yes stop_codon:yes gene_type:complete